jgi:hypothetical protein
VACSEILAQASATVAKSPFGPEAALGLGVAEAGAAADEGAPPACGAEQPVRASAPRRAARARGRAMFFEVTLQNHFSVEIAPPARTGLPAALVFFPQRASLAGPTAALPKPVPPAIPPSNLPPTSLAEKGDEGVKRRKAPVRMN